jgi:hypothetical protein
LVAKEVQLLAVVFEQVLLKLEVRGDPVEFRVSTWTERVRLVIVTEVRRIGMDDAWLARMVVLCVDFAICTHC